MAAPLKSIGPSLSYIQLMRSQDNRKWQDSLSNSSVPSILKLDKDSIHCLKDGLYFIYAQVTFSEVLQENQDKSVILTRYADGKSNKVLVEGTLPHTTHGSLWVAKIVKLRQGDNISINITSDFRTDSTFWGVYQLQ
uniref:CD40 ligand-like n=1 Tax=Scatophagus argus TaxID=75038 RepID=UPI001ED803AE|nr:CD40 ligand-like [Scatophagus argus]